MKHLPGIGERIKEARKKLGVSQHILARSSGVPQSQLCKYENHQSILSPLNAQKLARVLGTTAKFLLEGE